MINEYKNDETDLIITKINSLYPELQIEAIERKGNKYLVEIKYHREVLGSGSNQLWQIENNRAIYISSSPRVEKKLNKLP